MVTGDGEVLGVVPFLSVSDMGRSLRFYVQGLGFEVESKWEVEERVRWCSLRRGGAHLMLQEFPTEGHDSWKPDGMPGQGVSLWFVCEDALGIYRELTGRHIPATIPEVGNRMWVTTLDDPDGYRLNFESATDSPEGTRYEPGTG